MKFCFRFVVLLLLFLPGITEARTGPSDKNKVIAAVPSNFPPQYSVGANGKPEGFAIDVMDKIADGAGLQIQYMVLRLIKFTVHFTAWLFIAFAVFLAAVRIRMPAYVGVLFTVVMVILIQGCFKGESEQAKTAPNRNLLNHPIYSKYEFDKKENVINIGTQPLLLPTALITESLKRDTVLRNALSELGMETRFFPFLKGGDTNFFIGRGDIDVGIAGDMPAITAAANINVVIPTLIQYGFTSIVARKNILVSELRGKRIGYANGSNAHYALLDALASEGITGNDVTLVSMNVTDMPKNLDKGSIAAFSAWEPTPSIALNKYRHATVIHRSISTGYMYFLKTFSDKHPVAMRHIIAAEVRAIRWMQSEKRNLLTASGWALLKGNALSGMKSTLTVEQNMDLAEDDILGYDFDPIIPKRLIKQRGALHREFEFLQALGKIPASINWAKVQSSFNRQILKEVLANQDKYALNEFKYETNDHGNQ